MTHWLSRLCFFITLFAFCVILLGAYTRLKDAGLGCPDWPGCYGQLAAPNSAHAILQANAAFPATPVDVGKAQTEMTHRYFAETLGALIVVFAILSFLKRKEHLLPAWMGPLLVLLVLFQGLLGMWTVTMKLSPVIVMGHLLGGLCTLGLLTTSWLYLQSSHHLIISPPKRMLKIAAGATLGVLIVQIALGGWTSANYAALVCPDFPACHNGHWWPPYFLTAIHMTHRAGAICVALFGTVLSVLLWQTREPRLRAFSVAIITLFTLQIGLGIMNVLFSLPLPIALLHHAGAALLLLLIITVHFTLQRAPRGVA